MLYTTERRAKPPEQHLAQGGNTLLSNIDVDVIDVPCLKRIFNGAVKRGKNGDYIIIARLANVASPEGQPDSSDIVEVTLDKNFKKIGYKVLWEPKPGGIKIEDLRILDPSEYFSEDDAYSKEQSRIIAPSDFLGMLAIGATVAIEDENGNWEPHPAVIVTTLDNLANELENISTIESLGAGSQTTPIGNLNDPLFVARGKNVTPVAPDNPNLYMFRPEGQENNHRLVIFERTDDKATKKQTICLDTTPPNWMVDRMGTTIAPVWLNEHEALMPLHGYRIDKDNGKIIYSIGLAMLRKDKKGMFSIDSITDNAVINPDIIKDKLGGREIEELHDKRRVTYCCGGLADRVDGRVAYITLFVNVGDTETVIVKVPVAKYLEENCFYDQQMLQINPFKGMFSLV